MKDAQRRLALDAAVELTHFAYRDYRRLQHKTRLTGAQHARVDAAPQADRRAAVSALWSHVFGGPWR